MSGISFFTPVKYNNQLTSCSKLATELVDDYFYLGGRIAVVLPGNEKNGSEEISFQNGQTSCFLTALKIVSYFTVVIPVIMLVAKALLRSVNRYHTCNGEQPNSLPNPVPNEVRQEAPLTLVRSEEPIDLEISLSFNQQFRPVEPIEPKPSSINDRLFTWKVHANGDGTMMAKNERINMIWWEALRKGMNLPVESDKAVRVKRTELKEFLAASLKKMGVKESELEGFVNYWNGIFANHYDPQKAPYVLVQPIATEELSKYLPKMHIDGNGTEAFQLKRCYFRFEPLVEPNRGMAADAYLNGMKKQDLGANAVIDLGGEVAYSTDVDITKKWAGEKAYNDAFIRQYIYA